ncbi:MAG: YjjG family noncanonical pyrimidine nucleotidase [Clostridia bacterium]|nr:YjjG family noncanonical pyrimidine nucleotidase [Clostridia bacterium]
MTTDRLTIEVVLLDVDNTLLDFQAAQRTALVLAFSEMGFSCESDRETRFDALNKSYWRLFEQGKISRERLVVERFERFFEQEGLPGDAQTAERLYRKNLGKNHDLVPGAIDALRYLKSKYPVYLVTNGLKKTQEERLSDSGIDKLVDGVFISEEVGYRKPQKEFFSYVFSHIPPIARDQAVVIGDSLSGDIEGGRAAGTRTVWYNPKGKVGTADLIIKDWKEIYDIL